MPYYSAQVLINFQVEVDRSKFPFTLPVFNDFQSLDLHPEATFFVGENGSGKSTLLEAMAVNYGLPAEGGTKSHHFSTFDSHSDMHDKILLDKRDYPGEAMFLRAESFYNVASYTERTWRESGGSMPRFGLIHQRSHGEGFLDAIRSLRPPGFYLFDEPEAALSIQGQLTLLALLNELITLDSQVVIATHSPILLGFGRGIIYEFSESGIEQKTYKETANYKLTLDFLQNRDRYARIIGLPEM